MHDHVISESVKIAAVSRQKISFDPVYPE
jgi:hypothetical protein